MKIYCKKTYIGLIPASRNDFDLLQNSKLKDNEFYTVEVKKPRNVLFHRKYFSLLNICFENQEYFETAESLRHYLTMKAGYVNEIKTPDGSFFEPKSISFSSMDGIEFEKFYNASIDQVIKLIGVDKDDLINQILEFI